MHFLGYLGIDIKLLIAQLINFGLLVWLLARFVYRPSIRLIEKNEADLVEGKKMKVALDDDRKKFGWQKDKEMDEIKTGNKKTVEEMKAAAERIKSQISEKAEKESNALVGQTKSALAAEKPMLERELVGSLKKKMDANLRKAFDGAVAAKYQGELQAVLLKTFLAQINGTLIEKLQPGEIKELKKIAAKSKKDYAKKLREKIGVVRLEYATMLPAKDISAIEKIISAKIGLGVKVDATQNRRLVSGFRLEVRGRVIDSNLSTIVENAQN